MSCLLHIYFNSLYNEIENTTQVRKSGWKWLISPLPGHFTDVVILLVICHLQFVDSCDALFELFSLLLLLLFKVPPLLFHLPDLLTTFCYPLRKTSHFKLFTSQSFSAHVVMPLLLEKNNNFKLATQCQICQVWENTERGINYCMLQLLHLNVGKTEKNNCAVLQLKYLSILMLFMARL